MTRPPLLLVVGMHRSGTSLLGGILQHLGVAMPGDTIAGDTHNPEGYFEWDAVVAIQERLLIDLERWWPSAQGTLALPAGWLEQPATLDARARLRALLAAEVAVQERPWAIKDPRCSRLLPLWLALCRELEIPLQIVLAVRDPAEVVASLVRRDGPLTGMDAYRAQQLWWRHNLEVVHAARASSLPLGVVHFSGWFDQPETQLAQLLDLLPDLQPSECQQADALALINPEHRRSLSTADAVSLHPAVRRLHTRLLRQPIAERWPLPEPPRGLSHNLSKSSAAANHEGDPSQWPAWLAAHRHFPAPRLHHCPRLAPDPRVHVCGPSWTELEPQWLLQHLPIADLGQRALDPVRCEPHLLRLIPQPDSVDEEVIEALTLNLELPAQDRAPHWLAHLRSQQLIFDPDPARVLLLRALGLPAWWFDTEGVANGWLMQPLAVEATSWARLLGLAAPAADALILLGPAGFLFDRALAAEASAGEVHQPGIQYLPGWPELIAMDVAAGLARAGWLAAAFKNGGQLVLAGEQLLPSNCKCWPFPPGATPADLRALAGGEPLLVSVEDRPSPPQQQLFHWSSGEPPSASVLVSLYNYGDRITAALDSVAAQTATRLELIVVDDASTDEGADRVCGWMEARRHEASPAFARLLLLRHSCNAGLAAARNTAFSQAQANWCFVLDADNALYPQAVAACLQLAELGGEDLAVVHPLLAVEVEAGRADDQRSLVSTASWQRQRLLGGNVVDAMALVRRRAWQAVGGYTHIEGGWEDYDFWCKLIGSGWHGLQCPQLLAVYRSHADSMSHTATNRSWRALSRTLQERHPWLDLPMACA